MTYLSGRSKVRRVYMRYALVAVLLLLVVYYWTAIRTFLYPFAEPVIRGYASTKGVVTFMPSFVSTYFVSHKTLADKNAQLEVTIERLENELASKEAFIREQGFARSVAEANAPSTLVMYPLTEDITKIYSTIVLSKGYKDGVVEGGIVYIRGMQPVCTILEVHDRTSLCELFSKGKRITEAVTASGTVALSLSGIGGGNFLAEVPKGTSVAVGDEVYLRADQGLKLGSIVSIKQYTGMKLYVRGMYNPVTSSIFYMSTAYAR